MLEHATLPLREPPFGFKRFPFLHAFIDRARGWIGNHQLLISEIVFADMLVTIRAFLPHDHIRRLPRGWEEVGTSFPARAQIDDRVHETDISGQASGTDRMGIKKV